MTEERKYAVLFAGRKHVSLGAAQSLIGPLLFIARRNFASRISLSADAYSVQH
jgi:hypothetical protein